MSNPSTGQVYRRCEGLRITYFFCGAVASLFLLAGCATADPLPDDPFMAKTRVLTMTLVNYTDRAAGSVYVDKYWAGAVAARKQNGSPSGGGKAACCHAGIADWRKPLKITWQWSAVREPLIMGADGFYKQGKVIQPAIDRSAVVYPPPRFPVVSDDVFKDEEYLCVIFRDLDTVELRYAPGSTFCAKDPVATP